MAKKCKIKKTSLVPFTIVGLLAIGVAIAGLVIITRLDLEYENRRLGCDQKNYSSLVKVDHEETPGNENINNQLEIVERAMQSAKEANDIVAYGQLWEKYNELLELQAKTKTTNEVYDYSEVDKAKSRCKTTAKNQKQMDFQKGLWLFIPSMVVLCGDIIVFLCVSSKKEKTKTH